MEITLSLLADAANASQDGKLNILGIYRVINAVQTPVVHPHMIVVLKVRASTAEIGTQHQLTLVMVDADGKNVLDPIKIPLEIPTVLDNDVEVNLLANINNVLFPRFGDYRIDIAIDQQSMAQIDFDVRQVRMNPPPQQPEQSPPAGWPPPRSR